MVDDKKQLRIKFLSINLTKIDQQTRHHEKNSRELRTIKPIQDLLNGRGNMPRKEVFVRIHQARTLVKTTPNPLKNLAKYLTS